MDVDEAIHGVLMEHAKGTKREAVLREILGKALAAGVAGMLVFSYSDGSISRMEKTTKSETKVNNIYIVCTKAVRFLRRWMRELLSGIPHQNVPEILRQAPPVVIDAG